MKGLLRRNFSSSFLTMGSFKWKRRAAGVTHAQPETAHYFWPYALLTFGTPLKIKVISWHR